MHGKRLFIRLRVALAIIAATLFVTSTRAQTHENVLYSFCAQTNCIDGFDPAASLISDAAGNLYGTTYQGGANNCGFPYNGCGTVFELTPTAGGGWTEEVLHTFSNGADGATPEAALIFDAAGNLYGTTQYGGAHGGGTAFELTPTAGGGWTEQVLYSFCSQTNCTDGAYPPAGLIFDAAGNLYGTTWYGGTNSGPYCPQGCGTVFELTPAAGGAWTEKVLYSFCSQTNCADGDDPVAGVRFDQAGNLYGTTYQGGSYPCEPSDCGTVFELTPAAGGGWTEQVLYTFGCCSGVGPVGGLIFDAAGNLYGALFYGGTYYGGAVFELTPQAGGSWALTVLHSFGNGADGDDPDTDLIFDAGNLYGTTSKGGTYPCNSGYSCGTVFELTPNGSGGWTEQVLHSFGNGADGAFPVAGLIVAAGNLYGTTAQGGTSGGGTVFELTSQLVATTTALTAAPNPSDVGQAVAMAAAVRAQNGSTPTGTVVFASNGVQIGSVMLNNSGVAVLSYAGLSAGTDSLTAVYQGSSTLASSISNVVPQVVRPDGSTTSVTSSPNPSTFGEAVTITATVSPSGPPTPTGTVSFTSNSAAIAGCTAVPLSSSMAVCTTSSLAVGTDAIVAAYSGDGNYGSSSGMLSQIVNPVPSAVQFVPLTPCRVVDTRKADGTFGGPAIAGNSSRSFPLSQGGNPCGIPSSAIAYSLNVTVVPITTLGYLTIWPSGEGQPTVSTLNSPDGRIKANAAIVPAGTPSGSVSVYVSNTTNVILDIDGYFATPASGTYQFYTLAPCRIVDTRNGQDQGTLHAGVERDYTIAGQCGIPSDAKAYSFNVTVLPSAGGLDYLTVWPEGEPQPGVSTLNDNTGTIVANAAIVPAGSNNKTAFYAHSNSTNLLLDVDGYFAAPGTGGLSLYPLTPCRVLDTRQNHGQPFSGEKAVNVVGSACAPPSTAAAYVFNATVVPPGSMPFLTLWPNGENQPGVSTLNAVDGFITSNMAIVPTTDGSIDAYAQGLTQLILDISGYFAP